MTPLLTPDQIKELQKQFPDCALTGKLNRHLIMCFEDRYVCKKLPVPDIFMLTEVPDLSLIN